MAIRPHIRCPRTPPPTRSATVNRHANVMGVVSCVRSPTRCRARRNHDRSRQRVPSASSSSPDQARTVSSTHPHAFRTVLADCPRRPPFTDERSRPAPCEGTRNRTGIRVLHRRTIYWAVVVFNDAICQFRLHAPRQARTPGPTGRCTSCTRTTDARPHRAGGAVSDRIRHHPS